MRSKAGLVFLAAIVALGAGFALAEHHEAQSGWSMNATIIEACSCPMFCQCYFNTEPAAHGHGGDEHHYCKFNNAFKVNSGHHGETDLSGALFWVAGDLGSDFSDGRMDWAKLHFDPEVTSEQRAAVGEILGHVYPVEWDSFTIEPDAEMEWGYTDERAEASLDGGEVAHVILNRMANHGANPVIADLNYWGLPRHEGFVLMPNEIEAYRSGENAFEYSGGNGFMLTFELSSDDVAAMAAPKEEMSEPAD